MWPVQSKVNFNVLFGLAEFESKRLLNPCAVHQVPSSEMDSLSVGPWLAASLCSLHLVGASCGVGKPGAHLTFQGPPEGSQVASSCFWKLPVPSLDCLVSSQGESATMPRSRVG